ncbi:MAG: hypothetical protein ACAH08_01895 [Methylophilus sp.]
MEAFENYRIGLCLALCAYLCPLPISTQALAASDSAKVIRSTLQHDFTKANAKPVMMIALVNMDEILPECQQYVIKTNIQGVRYSESSISIDSIHFSWSGAKLDVHTNIGEEAIFTIDDIRSANKLIQVGKSYLIHFQQCGDASRRSLINLYIQNGNSPDAFLKE